MTELSQKLQTTAANDGSNAINTTSDQEYLPEEFIDLSKNYTKTTYHHTSCTACGCSGSPSIIIPATVTTTTTDDDDDDNYKVFSSCNENKRRHHDPTARFLDSLPVQDHQIPKKPKKLFLDDQSQEETIVPNSLHGFSKITLPSLAATDQSPNNNPTTPTTHRFESLPGLGPNQSPVLSPESIKMAAEATARTPSKLVSKARTAASLPPLPPPLRRTVSDPSPNSKSSGSSLCAADRNPNYQVLKRMRDCIKEMSHWWDEFLPDKVTGGEEPEEDKATEVSDPKKQDDKLTDIEEAVQVERTGDCLAIDFKCPCKKGYKILLSGNSCYYKLM